MVKFAANFCYCAVNQEKAVFQWKRAVSGPSALLGLEMVKFAPNFCYYAVDREKAVFKRKRAVSGPFAFLGLWEQPEKSQNLSGREHNMLRISLGEARKRSTNGMNKGRNDQNWSGKERKNRRKARRARYRRKGGGFRVFTLYIALSRTRGPGLALMRTCSRLWCCVRASTIFRGRHVARDGAGRKSSEVRLGRRRCRAAALRPQFRV